MGKKELELAKKLTNRNQNPEFRQGFDAQVIARGQPAIVEAALTYQEEARLNNILDEFQDRILPEDERENNYQDLRKITSQVKSILNTSLYQQGECVKRAQEVLKSYREGAFTAWLQLVYGNRQTGYNMLYYYNLHQQLPPTAQLKLDNMPKKAVYALGSIEGALDRKIQIIEGYEGQKQDEVLEQIRQEFPGNKEDKRRTKISVSLVEQLSALVDRLEMQEDSFSKKEKSLLKELGERIANLAI